MDLKQIANENRYLIINSKYHVPKTYIFHIETEVNRPLQQIDGTIELVPTDTATAIEYYSKKESANVCALNFANAFHPGGGYLVGARAQEEELCRQFPHLYASLRDTANLYPMHMSPPIFSSRKNKIAITHRVPMLRQSKKESYTEITTPDIWAGFITVAAPNLHDRGHKGKHFGDFELYIDHTLNNIFYLPISNNIERYDTLIVGAWGCGAFAPSGNDGYVYRKKMAEKMVRIATKWKKYYRKIVFAIPPGKDGNLEIFKGVLMN